MKTLIASTPKKTLRYGIKPYGAAKGSDPRIVTRDFIKVLLEGLAVVRRNRFRDGTRVFQLDDGSIIYMQFMTEKQAANYR